MKNTTLARATEPCALEAVAKEQTRTLVRRHDVLVQVALTAEIEHLSFHIMPRMAYPFNYVTANLLQVRHRTRCLSPSPSWN
jgi:hypothetical protein